MRKSIVTWIVVFVLVACNRDPVTPDEVNSYKDAVMTAMFQRTSGVVAADGAHSIALNNGKSLWLFGDSYIDNYDPQTNTVPCLFQVRNAATLVDNNAMKVEQTLLGNGSPKSYLKHTADNDFWFWPGHGYEKDGFIYVFQNMIHRTGSGSFGFEEIDSLYVAKINKSNLNEVSYSYLGRKNGISFCNGVVQHNGYVYIYGIKNNGMGRDLYVARYADNDITNTWEYRTASGWSAHITDAVKIHDEFTASFHVAKVNNKFVLVTTEFSVGCDQGSEIYSYIAGEPFGPFTNRKTVWKVDDTLEGHLPFFYSATVHPEFDNGKDELLLTYCINNYGNCVETCINNRFDPDHYRPRAIRVSYSSIGL